MVRDAASDPPVRGPTVAVMADLDRPALRRALLAAHPWLAATAVGPQAVAAGECDHCGRRPRLLPTCGPVAWTALCRDCALAVGSEAWCEGHADEAATHLAWAAGLPADWETAARLWWVATGEVHLDPSHAVRPADLPPADADGGPPPR